MGINWKQAGVLADRYLDTILADWAVTGLLLLQAPLLGLMAGLVWGNTREANSALYFVMTLSCLWIGCMDACREIVKERALFLRERMFNLEVGAYLVSKLRVLLMLNLVQAISYGAIVAWFVDVRLHVIALILILALITFTGTCLGLLISALSGRSDAAVGMVPLVILPQILFSEFAIAKDDFAGVSEVIYTLMPSRWGYESLKELAKTEPDHLRALAGLAPLLAFCALFVLLCWPPLRWKKY
jgi:ABC-type multidrug transport system permease subunit